MVAELLSHRGYMQNVKSKYCNITELVHNSLFGRVGKLLHNAIIIVMLAELSS